jgi:hypothetical protein
MMNQIKELKDISKEEFIIEISLIILESLKKFTISIFISEPVTVLELKELISKDFDYKIEDMIIFYRHQGILENSYTFQAEPNQKIKIELLIDDKKIETNELHKKISIDYKETSNLQNSNILINKKVNSNYSLSISTKNDSYPIESDNKNLTNNNINVKNDYHLPNNINLLNNKNICDINDNKRINANDVNKNLNKNENINLNIFKNNKCNFVLTKMDSPKYQMNDFLLGKKRRFPTTFKTTIHKKEDKETNEKAPIKSSNNNNFKVINFKVNKNIVP